MSQSKKKAAGAYKAPLTLLYAGIAAQAFGIAALALVSRRVLDEGGRTWGGALGAVVSGAGSPAARRRA